MTIPNDCVQGIIIRTPSATDGDRLPPVLIATAVPKASLDTQDWIISPLSAQLGMPLKLKQCQLSDSLAYNYYAQQFLSEPDPKDREFGMSFCDKLQGDVLAVRAGCAQSLGLETLQGLTRYIREDLAELRSFWRTEYADRAARAQEIAVKISKEAYDRRHEH